MNDCKHANGFYEETCSFSGGGDAYIIRCNNCKTAIGVIPEDVSHKIRDIQSTVNNIQHKVNQLR